ncbi:MAG: 23S rRNA (adenine(2503)-C(2))-methyltransferase RlmN [Chitinophagales bacterium]|nr:23S rRNA (adenine(2503)-C(2))-methyltransferase RlmN [Chitinophagales bacterium]
MEIAVEKIDIRKLSKQELESLFVEMGEQAFRARQVYDWLWKRSAISFEQMTNLSKPLREKLAEKFAINALEEHVVQKSNDGTIKSAFKLFDGNIIEGVMIPTETRMTACVSSQVGCSLSCKFCATGFLGRKRNLEPGEIYDQVVLLNRQALQHFNKPLSNIVFMGMGEPLLTYANVLRAIEHICSPEGLNISYKRVTVSTAGIAKMIKKLGDDGVKFNLALSLHAANDEKRNTIMAINESNNLDALVEALNYFYRLTGNKITFEYILFNEFNDSLKDADELIALCKRVPAKVNVIEYNPVEQVNMVKPPDSKRDKFVAYLEKQGVVAKVRRSRGKDIDAACGQLANKH